MQKSSDLHGQVLKYLWPLLIIAAILFILNEWNLLSWTPKMHSGDIAFKNFATSLEGKTRYYSGVLPDGSGHLKSTLTSRQGNVIFSYIDDKQKYCSFEVHSNEVTLNGTRIKLDNIGNQCNNFKGEMFGLSNGGIGITIDSIKDFPPFTMEFYEN